MAYPSTVPGIESFFEPAVGHSASRARGGAGLAKDTYQGRQTGTFNLVYRALTQTEKDAFFTDFDSDPGSFSFTWTLGGSTHTVVYESQPVAILRQDGNAWDVFVRLAKIPALGADIDDEAGDPLFMESGVDLENEAA